MSSKTTNALILAAGFSTRMGMPKYALKLRDGKTFLESLVSQYLDFGCEKIVVVLNPEGMKSVGQSFYQPFSGVEFLENPVPEAGRFISIKLGLKALGDFRPVFMQNVDNPFAPGVVLERLRKNLAGFDFVKPVYLGKGGHPVLIGPTVIGHALMQPSVDKNFKYFLETFHGKKVEVEETSILININTPEEYKRFL